MRATWYFDFVSPFAYLQWQRIRGLSEHVTCELRPVLFAGLLDRHGQKGPAEIPSKRLFTYRFVYWRATQQGVTLNFPPAHPFNPLAALRLCVAAGSSAVAVDAIFNHLWRDGLRGDCAESLTEVSGRLGLVDAGQAIESTEVKMTLREDYEATVEDKVFGVPMPTPGRGLLQEFGLSNAEGVMRMYLAEFLLRIPDDWTVDPVIGERLQARDVPETAGGAGSRYRPAYSGPARQGRVLEHGDKRAQQRDPVNYPVYTRKENTDLAWLVCRIHSHRIDTVYGTIPCAAGALQFF